MRRIFLLSVFLLCLPCALFAQTAEELLQQGAELAQRGQFAKARDVLTSAIALKPEMEDAYFERAHCNLNLKAYEAALKDMDIVLSFNPTSARAYVFRAMTFANSYELDMALADIERAILLDPNLSGSYTLRGQIRMGLGEKDLACIDFNRGVDLGDRVARRLAEQHCGLAAQPNESSELGEASQLTESLELKWPKEENWRPAHIQENDQMAIIEFLRNNDSLDNWSEMGTMITIKNARNVPVDTLMAFTYRQALLSAPESKLTFIEKNESVEHPWILFTIESPKFVSDPRPESQMWYIVQGKMSVYSNFYAIKQSTIPNDLRTKWSAFFKKGKVVMTDPSKN